MSDRLKLRLLPRSSLKGKVSVRFPASIAGQSPIVISQSAGALVIGVSEFTAAAAGVVPGSGGGAVNFLRADGTWVEPPGSGSGGGGRETLTASRTYWVRTDGSDSNTGLANSTGGAFLTLQKAINVVTALDLAGFGVTIQVGGTGVRTFTAGVSVDKPFLGGIVTLVGDATTPSNVVISVAGHCINVLNNAALNVQGFKCVAGSIGVLASEGGVLNITGKMDYGACGVAHITASGCGIVSIFANYSVTGGSQRHWWSTSLGFVLCENRTLTFTGSIAFGAFAASDRLGLQRVGGCTFSGGTITGTRYSVQSNSVIEVNGAGPNYLPGNAAGVPATGGQYN